MSADPLFVVEPERAPLEPPTQLHAATAEDVKDALRRRHPGANVGGMVGQWTCIEECGARTTFIRRVRSRWQRPPLPDVVVVPEYMHLREGESEAARVARYLSSHEAPRVPCWVCGGRGYLERSRVEREAPTCWVPRDLGLVTISARGCRVVKRSPRRKNPAPIAPSRKAINDLVRWVSHRPDPRHRKATA